MPLPTDKSFDDLFGYRQTKKWAKSMCNPWMEFCEVNAPVLKYQLPNIVTTINIVVTVGAFASLYLGATRNTMYYAVGLIFLGVRQYLDMLDGSVARTCDMKSKFGNYYDHISDAVFIVGLLTLFVYLTHPSMRPLAIGVAGIGLIAFMSEIVQVILEKDSVVDPRINDNLIAINLFMYMAIVLFIEWSKKAG